jgi:hypothetical protein
LQLNSSFFINWYKGSSNCAHRHPAAHGFARDLDAMPLEHLLLPVQRLMISPFRHDHLRQ